MATEEVFAQHPFTPASLPVPDYVPNSLSREEIGGIYGGSVLAVFLLAFMFFRRDCSSRRLSLGERLLMCWFTVSGFTHLILEASFVVFGKSIAWREDFFSQLWKGWSLADSRYVSQHAGVYAIEVISAVFDGPMCLLVLWMTYFRSPSRYAAEMLLSAAQLYGTVTCFLDAHFSDYTNIAVHDPFLFWAYFVGCNAPWVVIPIGVIVRDVIIIASSQSLADGATGEQTKKKK